jgi:hypothetical protein
MFGQKGLFAGNIGNVENSYSGFPGLVHDLIEPLICGDVAVLE